MGMDEVNRLRIEGNEAFRDGKLSDALALYERALEMGGDALPATEIARLWSNSAQCLLGLQRYEAASEASSRSLEHDSDNVKALYRRGKARAALSQFDRSIADFKRILQIDAGNSAASRALKEVADRSARLIEELDSLVSRFSDVQGDHAALQNKVDAIVVMFAEQNDAKRLELLEKGFVEWILTQMLSTKKGESALDKPGVGRSLLALLAQNHSNQVTSHIWLKGFEPVLYDIANAVKETNHSILIQELSLITARAAALAPGGESWQILAEAWLFNIQQWTATTPESSIITTRALYALKTLASIALLDPSKASSLRDICLKSILLSDFNAYSTMENEAISAVAVLANDGTKPSSQDGKEQFSDSSTGFYETCEAILAPALREEVACKDFLTVTKIDRVHRALGGLVIVLHASIKTGLTIIAQEKVLTHMLQVALIDTQRSIQQYAGEALAIASSDASIRKAIVEAGFDSMFFSALSSRKPVVAAYGGLALSKLAAVNASCREKVLEGSQVLRRLGALIAADMKGGDFVPTSASRISLEAFVYLSIYLECKQALVTADGEKVFQNILTVCKHQDHSLQFAVLQILTTMATSSVDLERGKDREVEALRQAAAKGLEQSSESKLLEEVAGTESDIKVIRKRMLELGVVNALVSTSQVQSGSRFRSTMARCLSYFAADRESRGILVQQGGLRLLLATYAAARENGCEEERPCLNDSVLAIARICISVNPNLFQSIVLLSLPNPLLDLLKNSTHELHAFEALLAITNLASVNDETREALMGRRAWYELQMACTSENQMIQRAAVEALANLTPCNSVFERLHSDAGSQDVRIFVAFASSDDLATRSASLAALATLSMDPTLLSLLIENGVMQVVEQALNDEDEGIVLRAKACSSNLSCAAYSKNDEASV